MTLYLDGSWRDGHGPELISFDPANSTTLWHGHEASPADVDLAFESAAKRQPAWAALNFTERLEILHRFVERVREQRDELARVISREVGKPQWDALTEIDAVAGKLAATESALTDRRVETTVELGNRLGRTRYTPLGVVAVFGPFNFPMHIANGVIMPALLAGNTVVFKPSELTPLSTEVMVKLWEQAGLPPGTLQLVQGSAATGQAILRAESLRGVFFTGSRATGIRLREALTARLEVLLALELGGNNPLVVHRPDHLETAVNTVIQSAFVSSGQRCTCVRRLIVTGQADEFLEALAEATRDVVVGDPQADPQPYMGPLVNATAVDRLLEEQQRLIEYGSTPIVHAERLSLGECFVSPGLLDVTHCTRRSDEEIFGPLLQVIRVDNLSQAIEEANDTEFGLAAGILTAQREDFDRFRHEVRSGLINWNLPTTGASGRLPFGGLGHSGNYRPAGYHAIDFCNAAVAELEPLESADGSQ